MGLCGKNKKLILLLAGATITLLIDCMQWSEKKVQIINLNPFKTNVQSNLKSYWSIQLTKKHSEIKEGNIGQGNVR